MIWKRSFPWRFNVECVRGVFMGHEVKLTLNDFVTRKMNKRHWQYVLYIFIRASLPPQILKVKCSWAKSPPKIFFFIFLALLFNIFSRGYKADLEKSSFFFEQMGIPAGNYLFRFNNKNSWTSLWNPFRSSLEIANIEPYISNVIADFEQVIIGLVEWLFNAVFLYVTCKVAVVCLCLCISFLFCHFQLLYKKYFSRLLSNLTRTVQLNSNCYLKISLKPKHKYIIHLVRTQNFLKI